MFTVASLRSGCMWRRAVLRDHHGEQEEGQMTPSMLCSRLSASCLLLASVIAAVPAWADTELRLKTQPITDPVQAFVTVTDEGGDPLAGLTAADFGVTLDGVPVVIQPSDLTLPPAQDPNQKISVIFVMDFSTSVVSNALAAMQDAVIAFIDAMNDGDRVAILKFNGTLGTSIVQEFVAIDHGANSAALEAALMEEYDGDASNIYDALQLGIEHFVAPPNPLPPGPKALILVSDGGENASVATESGVISLANDHSLPIFTVGVGNFTTTNRLRLLTTVAEQTGADFLPAPTDEDIAVGYATLFKLLDNEYLLTIASNITDCAVHTLEVAVAGQATPASATFTRRDCDVMPDPFSFTSQSGLTTGRMTTSNTVTITGIETDVVIDSSNGTYSIGCNGSFTNSPGTISNGQTVCVRHSTSAEFSATKVTTVAVGGASATFTTTTRSEPSGGGGATGALELLIGLLLLRRRPAGCGEPCQPYQEVPGRAL
jgi:VWFA-related protein